MHHKSCALHVNTLTDSGEFEGYASIFNVVDSHADVVCKGAFKKSLMAFSHKTSIPKMLWQHQATYVVGVWTHMEENEKGLYVKGRLLLDVEKGREAYVLLKEGALEGLSIGFIPRTSYKGFFNNTAVTYLTELDLHEISLVTFASNPYSMVTDVKHTASPFTNLCTYINSLCNA